MKEEQEIDAWFQVWFCARVNDERKEGQELSSISWQNSFWGLNFGFRAAVANGLIMESPNPKEIGKLYLTKKGIEFYKLSSL